MCFVSGDYCEPAALVLKAMAEAGYSYSREQLSEWHRIGVIPKPRTVSLGRGKGRESRYPRGTTVTAINCAGLLKQGWSFERTGWELWLLGFLTRKRLWRPIVDRGVEMLTDFASEATAGGPGDREFSDRLEEHLRTIASASELRQPFGAMRRRLRTEFEAAIALALSAAVGALHTGAEESSDERLVGRLTGMIAAPKKRSIAAAAVLEDKPSELLERLKAVSAAMDKRIEDGFESSDNYALRARGDFVFALRCYRGIQDEEEKQTGKTRPEAKLIFDVLSSSTPYQQAAFMILFSNIIDACQWRAAFEEFKHEVIEEVRRQRAEN